MEKNARDMIANGPGAGPLQNFTRRLLPPVLQRAVILALVTVITSTSGQTQETPPQKSEFIAPGIEHIQLTRGDQSDKESTGPWFITSSAIS